ncbi:cd7 antigen-like [Syngnathoides biaculeatus]|uniref:cd7 antigen-like n=1 Tax=Syngnathoides biaculeatus TaxID=300417 RepID=UPI002ADE451B|nr:cd7 antigen-like [Syngnathoides biaculeatus]
MNPSGCPTLSSNLCRRQSRRLPKSVFFTCAFFCVSSARRHSLPAAAGGRFGGAPLRHPAQEALHFGLLPEAHVASPRPSSFQVHRQRGVRQRPRRRTAPGGGGDPSSRSLTVTLSELTANDTDRYECEFVVARPSSEDELVPGDTEFFLLVNAAKTGRIEVCEGGSAVVPCLPPRGEDLPVEGARLIRRRGPAPAELLYHTKRHSGEGQVSASSRFQLGSAPGPGGFTYNLTLRHLRPQDGGLYSCQLLLRGLPDASVSLDASRAVFVSVEGPCGCSNYPTLLYALSSAVLVLIVLLTLMLIYHKRARSRAASRPAVPIYEEMAGVKTRDKLDDGEGSEYRNCKMKKTCTENHYETPIRSAF